MDPEEDDLPNRLRGLDEKSRQLRLRKRDDNGLLLLEMRCRSCNRFMGRQAILIGGIELKCGDCKQITAFDFDRVGNGEKLGYTEPVLPEGHRLAKPN